MCLENTASLELSIALNSYNLLHRSINLEGRDVIKISHLGLSIAKYLMFSDHCVVVDLLVLSIYCKDMLL